MITTWGITITFLSPKPDAEPDILDNVEVTADSDDPTLRVALVAGEQRLEVGTVAELIERLREEAL